jgi:hypothetical protein
MRTGLRFTTAILSLALFMSCGHDVPEEETEETEENTTETVSEAQKAATQNIFNSVPGSDDVSDMVARSGAEYDPNILNNPDNYGKYTSEDYKAINLGVYGVDLSYTSVFEQTQESMLFLKCVNQSCKSLGIAGVFDEKTVDRITANKENKDSLLQIISKSFWQADAFLKENQRAGTSSLMVVGGWVEGMYLGINIAKISADKKIKTELAKQKASLENILILMNDAKVAADVGFILTDLKDLLPAFDTPMSEDPKTVGAEDPFIKALDQKVLVLRNKITKN